jgi:chromosome partitioning protein
MASSGHHSVAWRQQPAAKPGVETLQSREGAFWAWPGLGSDQAQQCRKDERMDQAWTVEETARVLNVTPRTVQRMCASGEMPHTRVKRVIRIFPSELVAQGLLPASALDGAISTRSPNGTNAARPDLHESQSALLAEHSARDPLPLPTTICRVIAIANQKGGVGKTTTAVNLGAALGEAALQVLLLDLDAQANATTALAGRGDIRPGMSEILAQQVEPNDCLRQTDVPGLSIIPSNITLANAEPMLIGKNGRELVLRPVIAAVRHRYDVILLDCPPTLGVLTVAGLMAADEFIVPVRPHLFSALGLQELFKTVADLRRQVAAAAATFTGPITAETLERMPPQLTGVLVNQGSLRRDGSPRGSAYQEVLAVLREDYGSRLFETTIPETVVVEEAIQRRTSVLQWAPNSAIAKAYRQLAEEVRARGN